MQRSSIPAHRSSGARLEQRSHSIHRGCHIRDLSIEPGSHRCRTPAAIFWGWMGTVMGDLCLCQHKSGLDQSNQTKFQYMSHVVTLCLHLQEVQTGDLHTTILR